MDRATESLFDRLLAPWALFLGVAAAFLACTLAGLVASRQNHFTDFERFHIFLTPETLFYPTARQVYQLAKSRLDPGKVAVIVGGNSVLQGFAQLPGQVWTRKLQALLGDRYQVINFGFCGANTAEFGAVAAEMLGRDYRRLILITDLPVGYIFPDPDGNDFKYFFWDAYCQGLLLPHSGRDQRLRDLAEGREASNPFPGRAAQPGVRPKGERQAELKAQMRLNNVLYFNDLWNTLAYTTLCTVWTPYTRQSVLRARQRYSDPDRGPGQGPDAILQDNGASLRRKLEPAVRSPRQAWRTFDRSATVGFPEPTRKRTLMLVIWFNPLYIDQLSPAERVSHSRVSRLCVQHLERLGFPALEVGKDYRVADFADICHMTESGGAKLAAAVAPRVRALARQLGYVK